MHNHDSGFAPSFQHCAETNNLDFINMLKKQRKSFSNLGGNEEVRLALFINLKNSNYVSSWELPSMTLN